MNIQQLTNISDKINELKALFIFGHRVMPFLEELFHFVQEVIPLLDEINKSIKDSTSKMPRASSQLSKVTEATELATTEILDTIDSVLFRLGEIKSSFNHSAESVKEVIQIDSALVRALRKELAGKNDNLLQKINLLHKQKLKIHKKIIANYSGFSNVLDEIHDSNTSIMMSLQVQDITSQQLAAVNHLIESIEERLGTLMSRFNNNENFEKSKTPNNLSSAFDPNATYDTSGSNQKAADDVFNNLQKTNDLQAAPAKPSTQDDIDKLFQNGGETAPKEDSIESNSQSPQKINQSCDTSQDEIDKMFS